jgi:hypothetical protein
MTNGWRWLHNLASSRKRISENLALIIAIAAVVIALWSARIQQDAMRLDERPYLKVTFSGVAVHQRARDAVHEARPDGYEVKMQVEVSGKTPAFRVDSSGFCDVEQKGLHNGWARTRWPFLFDEKAAVTCFVSVDLPDGKLPPNLPLSLTVHYDDIFGNHHTTTYCETIITMGGDESTPRRSATGAIPESPHCDPVMN